MDGLIGELCSRPKYHAIPCLIKPFQFVLPAVQASQQPRLQGLPSWRPSRRPSQFHGGLAEPGCHRGRPRGERNGPRSQKLRSQSRQRRQGSSSNCCFFDLWWTRLGSSFHRQFFLFFGSCIFRDWIVGCLLVSICSLMAAFGFHWEVQSINSRFSLLMALSVN